jgi:hypothetical protein
MEIHQKYLLKNNQDNDLVNSEKDSIYIEKGGNIGCINELEKDRKTYSTKGHEQCELGNLEGGVIKSKEKDETKEIC